MTANKRKRYLSILIGCLVAGAGIAHFTNADFFSGLVPASFGNHKGMLNAATGILQIGMGVTFWLPKLRLLARWSTIALLVATLPAAVGQVIHPETIEKMGLTTSIVIGRVIAQVGMIILIWWVTTHSGRKETLATSK